MRASKNQFRSKNLKGITLTLTKPLWVS